MIPPSWRVHQIVNVMAPSQQKRPVFCDEKIRIGCLFCPQASGCAAEGLPLGLRRAPCLLSHLVTSPTMGGKCSGKCSEGVWRQKLWVRFEDLQNGGFLVHLIVQGVDNRSRVPQATCGARRARPIREGQKIAGSWLKCTARKAVWCCLEGRSG